MISNIHERVLEASADVVAPLIDGLGSGHDRLWPSDRWPRLELEQPLRVGSGGGHGPIRYSVSSYQPAQQIEFRFGRGVGLEGHHRFEVAAGENGTTLRHTLAAKTRGGMRLAWPLIIRWLHDALIEDALDKAESAVTGRPVRTHHWSPWVRLLRAAYKAGG